ncbi:hypothetical protein JWV37_10205 [Sulfurospirillum sp. T05]|uniref:Uncharacterized protein n=1 Tax=Sulfurospirillum tamanense TaxID=2813362 RepID=A0ABS2WVD1_9BACT|nr:hypothetical protein [Sulfurospirillum tamanensis]MBN2965154.1 hypothetical protein [Sulfurospirillum tamanensis]
MHLAIKIQNKTVAQKILWLLERFKEDGVEVVEIEENQEALDDETLQYMKTEQFQKDKGKLHKTLKDIQGGKSTPLSQSEYDAKIQAFELRLGQKYAN